MELLPKWILTNPAPALYDAESGTAIEMVAKVYGAMNTLISEFNKMVDDVNSQIIKHKNSTEIDIDSFKTCVTSTIENYIKSIDIKISEQDKTIQDAILYMNENIRETTIDVVNTAIGIGKIKINEVYNPNTESLNLEVTGGV